MSEYAIERLDMHREKLLISADSGNIVMQKDPICMLD
jgi:hypothetical protein